MRQKIKVSILLIIFSLSIFTNIAQAATYNVSSASDAIVEFNRAMALDDKDITLEYSPGEKDYRTDLYDLQYSLQDYANSDYAYYNMNQVKILSPAGSLPSDEKPTVEYIITDIETPEETEYVYDTIHNLIKSNPELIKASNYEKALWAYDYVIDHVTYDYSYSKYSAYDALHDGTAVCQGYALLYYAMATELGLNCRIVSGTAGTTTKDSHAWNLIELEGKWYVVDTTWGAGSSDSSYFLALKKDLITHDFNSIYESYYNYADTKYIDNGKSGYHGVLASVYNAVFDSLKQKILNIGDTYQWMLDNPNQVALKLISKDTKVATVSDDGVVTAMGPGTTTISATNDELGIEQDIQISIDDVEAQVIGYHKLSLRYNDKADVALQLSPSYGKLKNVIYTSRNNNIATVNQNGYVTGVSVGTTSITVSYGNNQKVEVPVSVIPLINNQYKNITVSAKKNISIRKAAAVSRNGYKDLRYISTSSRTASVSSTGIVTGLRRGYCYIKIYHKATNKLIENIKVTVR